MYKEVLRSIEGIEIYPIIALLIFFFFFVGVIVWSARIDKERLRELSLLPLDGEAAQSTEGDGHE